LSRRFNITVVHLEYRRPPEHPLPAAVDDAVVLYRALLRDGISPSRLAIMGDSAGGGLALLTIQAILARRLPKPGAVITLSPWTDLSLSGESNLRNRPLDVIVRNASLDWIVDQVLGPNHAHLSRTDPVYSPLFGSFKDFPPLYVTVGTSEVLEDDSRRAVDRARQEGVDVTFEIGEHMMHIHPMLFAYFHEASDSLDNIGRWLTTKLN
jgi:epsilon-lactone hydrolase